MVMGRVGCIIQIGAGTTRLDLTSLVVAPNPPAAAAPQAAVWSAWQGARRHLRHPPAAGVGLQRLHCGAWLCLAPHLQLLLLLSCVLVACAQEHRFHLLTLLLVPWKVTGCVVCQQHPHLLPLHLVADLVSLHLLLLLLGVVGAAQGPLQDNSAAGRRWQQLLPGRQARRRREGAAGHQTCCW
jgi:hypothetical protein